MSFWGWKPAFEVVGKPTSSPEAQVRHLQACIKVQADRIHTLELELETLRIERGLEDQKLNRYHEAFKAVIEDAAKKLPKKKRWWHRKK